MSALACQPEDLTAGLLAEAHEIVERNHAETGLAHSPRPLLDDRALLALVSAGVMFVVTARGPAGELAGYNSMLLWEQGESMATQHALFLDRGWRRGRNGLLLVRATDAALRARGVDVVFRQSSRRRPMDALLLRDGYDPVETVYVRRL